MMHKNGATWSKAKVSRGSFSEDLALEMLDGRGWKATEHQDIYHHIDLFYRAGDEIRGADIKSIKLQNDKQFFVELKNSYGLKGWLYGKADEIWFECFDSFLIHSREVLMAMVDNRIKTISPFPTRKPACWRFYQREIQHEKYTKRDQTVIVPLADLELFGEYIYKTPEQTKRTQQFYRQFDKGAR